MTTKYHNSKFDRDIAEKAIKKAIREKLIFDRGGDQNDAFTADNIPAFNRGKNRFGRAPAPDVNESSYYQVNTHKLVHKSGKEQKVGDIVTDFRGDKHKILGFRPPHKPASTGRVFLKSVKNGHEHEYFPSVVDCEIKPNTVNESKRVGKVKRLINATGDVLGIREPRNFERDMGRTKFKNLADTLGHTALQVSAGAIGGAAVGVGAPVGAAMGAAAGIGFPIRDRYKFLKNIGEENTTLQSLTEERKESAKIVDAFLRKESAKGKRSHTDGHCLYLHGNRIAWHGDNGNIHATMVIASNTTKDRLNTLTRRTHGKSMFRTKKGTHYFGDKAITARDVVVFPANSVNEANSINESTRMAYVSRKKKDGSYHEVGGTDQSVFKGSPKSIRKRAREWANGAHRIEWVDPERPYAEPIKVDHVDHWFDKEAQKRRYNINEAKDTKHVSMTPLHRIINHYGPGEGRHWFDDSATKFFKTRYPQYAYTGKHDGNNSYFVTSEKSPSGERKYSVRHYNWDTRNIKTVGAFHSHTKESAHSTARELAKNDSIEALKKKNITEQWGGGKPIDWSAERLNNKKEQTKKDIRKMKAQGKLERQKARAEAGQRLRNKIHGWLFGRKKEETHEVAGNIDTLPTDMPDSVKSIVDTKKAEVSRRARIAALHGAAQRLGPHVNDPEKREQFLRIHSEIEKLRNEEYEGSMSLTEQMLEEGRGGINKVLARAGEKHGFAVKPGFYHAKYGYTDCNERTKEWHIDKLNKYLHQHTDYLPIGHDIYHNHVRLKNSKYSKAVKSLPPSIRSYLDYMRKSGPGREGRDAFYKKQTRKRKNAEASLNEGDVINFPGNPRPKETKETSARLYILPQNRRKKAKTKG